MKEVEIREFNWKLGIFSSDNLDAVPVVLYKNLPRSPHFFTEIFRQVRKITFQYKHNHRFDNLDHIGASSCNQFFFQVLGILLRRCPY